MLFAVETNPDDVNMDVRPGSGRRPYRTFIRYKNGVRTVHKVNLDNVNHPRIPQAAGGDQQSDADRKVALQYAYLTGAAERIQGWYTVEDDLAAANEFAKQLNLIFRKAIADFVRSRKVALNRVQPAELKAIGSLASGFALPDSDLDMTLLPSEKYPRHLETSYPRILEKKLLDLGYGARFLRNERFPTLQVCEKPSPELLKSLREEKIKRDRGQFRATVAEKFSCVEFPKGGVGVNCHISFSQPLAVPFRDMLRCYVECDHRVRKVVLFVKRWAKNRNINDPSRSSLSSTGYILMVLHYLMNVCNPPVIPNLQHDAPHRTSIIQGHKVYHIDESEIRTRAKKGRMSHNKECIASLIQGFFRYYAMYGPSSPESGFNWVRDTISIRTPGGLLPKHEKGWITGRREKGFYNSYLLAIEDPFDIAVSHGQTVNRAGLQLLKDEFTRANTIIQRIQYIPGAGMMWRNNKGLVGEDLLATFGEESYQETMSSNKPRRLLATGDAPEENTQATDAKTLSKPVPEPRHPAASRSPRGMMALLDSMARFKPPATTAKRQGQLQKNYRQQISRGAQEMRRIKGLEDEVSKWETSSSTSLKKVDVSGANHDVGEQKPGSSCTSPDNQEPNISKGPVKGGYGEKVVSDPVPSLTSSSGRESAEINIPDWDSLESMCSGKAGSNADIMAELPFEGINISFKKD